MSGKAPLLPPPERERARARIRTRTSTSTSTNTNVSKHGNSMHMSMSASMCVYAICCDVMCVCVEWLCGFYSLLAIIRHRHHSARDGSLLRMQGPV